LRVISMKAWKLGRIAVSKELVEGKFISAIITTPMTMQTPTKPIQPSRKNKISDKQQFPMHASLHSLPAAVDVVHEKPISRFGKPIVVQVELPNMIYGGRGAKHGVSTVEKGGRGKGGCTSRSSIDVARDLTSTQRH
jgi:hypothetical protein